MFSAVFVCFVCFVVNYVRNWEILSKIPCLGLRKTVQYFSVNMNDACFYNRNVTDTVNLTKQQCFQ